MVSEVLKMDYIDRRIIQLIQEQPNLTHTQIAAKVNRSQPTVGMRIRKLEEMGVLQFQAGINIKSADMYFASVEIQTKEPEEIYEIVKICPFMLNAFRVSGDFNISVLITSFTLEDIEKIVNIHFRNKLEVKKVNLHIITDVVTDFIVPIDFNIKKCRCKPQDHCW
ncbi:MAG: Lrp/AsnC family transcriptional regulator [Candidatus Thorarchaeota archaeon]